jgi:GTP-binding protein
MKITSATYARSIIQESDLPEDQLPQYAFIGRSNVGKSSFLNAITNLKNLGRTGSRPGLTQKVNLFLINKKIYFADLPGYGYAKASKTQQKTLANLIFWYLEHPDNQFREIFLLIDSKVGPTPLDLEVIDFLDEKSLPFQIIASKVDQLKNSERARALKNIQIAVGDHNIIPFSSHTKEGQKTVLELIQL